MLMNSRGFVGLVGLAAAMGCSTSASTPSGAGNDGPGGTSSGAASGDSIGGGSGDVGSTGSASTSSGRDGDSSDASTPSGSPSSGDAGGDTSSDASTSRDGGDAAIVVVPAEAPGCGATKLYKTPDDLSVAGPWPVGVKTAKLTLSGVSMPIEVWYPAPIGSDRGQTQASYDIRAWLPGNEASKIPDSANKLDVCDCYRGLPLDTAHGPYPAVIFIHGTGSFRVASLSTMTAWASRGFVVVAADHPGLFLTDFLASGNCAGEGTGTSNAAGSLNLADVDAEVAALTSASGDFAFLDGHVDMSRIALSGHSQGASGAASASSRPGVPNVQVDMPLADLGGTVPAGSAVRSTLFMGGASDSVVPYSSDVQAYQGSTAAVRRVVGITGGNHLDVTDLCYQTNATGKTAIQVANQYDVCGTGAPSAALSLLNALAQCGSVSPPIAGPEIVNYATTAALEETLHCVARDAAFAALQSKYTQVSDYRHTP